jgi:Sec-independent protein translocase protein TatA
MKFMNLGGMELLIILILAILAIGPQETAKFAKQANSLLKNVKGVFSDLTSEVSRAVTDTSAADEKTKN